LGSLVGLSPPTRRTGVISLLSGLRSPVFQLLRALRVLRGETASTDALLQRIIGGSVANTVDGPPKSLHTPLQQRSEAGYRNHNRARAERDGRHFGRTLVVGIEV
jgi:hypothetical protein